MSRIIIGNTTAIPSTENNIYVGVKTSDNISDTEAINNCIGESIVNKGDICIIKTLLQEDTELYSHKGFIYNGTNWEAMDGNYEADNVYFREDIVLAGSYTTVGNVSKSSNTATGTLSAAGKSVKDVIQSIFTKELQPTKSEPAVTTTLTDAGAKEVGTTFTPSYSASLSTGSYTYGPATGITDKSWTVTDTNGYSKTVDGIGSLSISGTLTSFIVTDDTNYTVTAKATYDAGVVAKTNLGNLSDPEVKIAAGSKSKKSSAVTGFRYTFYGSNVAAIDLTSANIRNLAGKTSYTNNTFSVEVVEGAKQVVIAIPSGKTLTKVEDTGAFGTDIVGSFIKSNVNVSGLVAGENLKEYNVYVYTPDAALGANTYDVTIG